ncbi:MAG TPA: hypothetical protein VNB24_03485, partial [Acidimicrobiales bacterium]|nr:hypothetical protein [Acidimicrobiales bacterium]
PRRDSTFATGAAVVGAVLLVVVIASLLIPTHGAKALLPEGASEMYNCGAPLGFVLGDAENEWREFDGRSSATTAPKWITDVGVALRKHPGCLAATAGRLRVTYMSLLGAACALLLALWLASPPRRRTEAA